MWRDGTVAALGCVRHTEQAGANNMAHRAVVPALRPKDLSSSQQAVLRPPDISCNTHTHTHN